MASRIILGYFPEYDVNFFKDGRGCSEDGQGWSQGIILGFFPERGLNFFKDASRWSEDGQGRPQGSS